MRFFFLLSLLPALSWAQYRQPNAAEIKLRLEKLNVLGSVLYVAAHPDDENTRAIAFFANDRLFATAYLSLTRGDGGQNLIGPELRDQLGLIRTQELMAARRLDGGQQFFTRANDFGFSKNQRETMEIWGKENVLADVVRVIRQFKPDIIINRFPPDERAGHGHHTASAILSQEAFDAAADPTRFPEQVKEFGTWQVKRIYTNTGRWWNQTINENTPGVVSLNVGTYNKLLGKSYSEIAAESRSQHKSQGFGSPGRRGDALEFFEYAKGERAGKDLMEGVDVSWTRVKGGEKVKPLIERAIAAYHEEEPEASIAALLEIRTAIYALEPSVWRDRKLKETEELIQACAGLFVEVVADQYRSAPNERVSVSWEIINRSKADVKLHKIVSSCLQMDTLVQSSLTNNIPLTFKTSRVLSPSLTYSDPYWLRAPHTQGLFTLPAEKFIGKPENDPSVMCSFEFWVSGKPLVLKLPVIYKWTDPVKGELWRPLEITPPVFVRCQEPVYLFQQPAPRPVTVLLKSSSSKSLKGRVFLKLPEGWKSQPTEFAFELQKRNIESAFTFQVIPAAAEDTFTISPLAEIDGKTYDLGLQEIIYDHIPAQTLLPKGEAKALRVNLNKEGSTVGYIRGAGDEIPKALRNMGYEVWEMKNEDVTAANLARVDAVVLGVRALNTNERIRFFMPALLDYVKAGGTLVVQYNTNFDLELDVDKIAPYSLTLSRERVTEENSEVKILNGDHPALNYPNKISKADFDGWVQERGLYFPSQWAPEFQPLLSCHDQGEPARNGGLLVAQYGTGYYVYTGLSFFRELPEGVPGAYKLFANLVSLGKKTKPQNQKVKASR
ncbi:MAG: PIG-L family deacetylase [Cyclobacteriaceae bacterium]